MAIVTLSEVKTFLQITDTSKDTLITALIPAIEADYLKIRNYAFDLDDDGVTIIYPDGSDYTASLMIGYALNKNNTGMKSESLGDYSYTKQDLIGEYPAEISKRIKTFINPKGGNVSDNRFFRYYC